MIFSLLPASPCHRAWQSLVHTEARIILFIGLWRNLSMQGPVPPTLGTVAGGPPGSSRPLLMTPTLTVNLWAQSHTS